MIYLVNDSPYFDLVIRSLAEVFHDLGIKHKIVDSILFTDGLYIICTVHEGKPLPQHYIAYNWEQLTTDKQWDESFFNRLGNAHCVWDYSFSNLEILQSKGISALHVPLGYTKCMEFSEKRGNTNRDIDMVFLGSINESRRQKLFHILRSYQKRPRKLVVSNSCWGDQMKQVYQRSKIGLNVHYYGGKTILEVLRIIPMLANGLFVISEHSDDRWYEAKLGPVVTWCEPDSQDLLRKSIELLVLSLEEQRQKESEQYDYLVRHCRFSSSIERFEVLSSLSDWRTNPSI